MKGLDAAWLARPGRGPAREPRRLADRGRAAAARGRARRRGGAQRRARQRLGQTVDYREPTDALLPSPTALADLVEALGAGQVKTLVVLGGNPAYDAPADLEFAAAAAKAEELVHFGSHVDETAALASWHVPSAHFLESWGDARASCGTLSVVQPLILPLYGAKSAVEVLGLLASGEDKPGHELVQATWRPILGEADFEKRWNRVLHDGVLPQSALPGVKLDAEARHVRRARRRRAGRRARASSSSCSRPVPSSTTARAPTTPGCRSCRTRSRRSPGTTRCS